MNKQLLKQYVENGGNCVNLGRFLNKKDNATYQWVLDQTPWLNDVKFTERVYCILNDIASQKLNAFGEPATFENRKIITFFVWEKSQTQDIENILCLLKTQNTKF